MALRLLSAVKNLFNFEGLKRLNREALDKNLRLYGLRRDDLLCPLGDMDVAEALRRVPQHEVDARNQRLRRAHDLYLKKETLPAELQAQQTPFLDYLRPTVERIKAENAERLALGSGKTYYRSIP